MTATGQGEHLPRHTNRLIHEASPYLQQHAHNPVDWYPWSDEALARARAEDKPIFLSVGYSACHWCHVMERESFEDLDIAALMNDRFINIKVDREERPDLDRVYQTVCQMVTRQGGWPLTVFLTPDLRPFYVGTYFPPADRYGRMGFQRLLAALAEVWQTRRADAEKVAAQWTANLQQLEQTLEKPEAARPSGVTGVDGGEAAAAYTAVPGPELLLQAAASLKDEVDREHGGFGTQPKFPSTEPLELMLRAHRVGGDTELLELVTLTLRKMAEGGIYDQLGGGFHRYSVDDHWAVPHFEKMLYDNALLAQLYLSAFQITGEPLFERVVRETLRYVQREMTAPEGGFYSTQDADSEDEEGKFFVWSPRQVEAVLGPEDGALACRYFGVTPAGNFEHRTTVLHVAMSPAEAGAPLGLSAEQAAARLAAARQALWENREQRVKPFRDEKILTSWNGLMISAFARAAQVFGDADYLASAGQAAAFLSDRLVASASERRLLRRYKDGQAGIPGYLEDYAYLTAGLLDLYEAGGEEEHLNEAVRLTRETLRLFWDPEGSSFFLTAPDATDLIVRPREITDSATPAAGSVAAGNLVRVYPCTGDDNFRATAEAMFRQHRRHMERLPWGMASLLAALDRYLHSLEITLVATAGDATAGEWAGRIHRRYLPNRVFSRVAPQRLAGGHGQLPPLWAGKTGRNGQATLYICRNFTCSPPLANWDEAETWLA